MFNEDSERFYELFDICRLSDRPNSCYEEGTQCAGSKYSILVEYEGVFEPSNMCRTD